MKKTDFPAVLTSVSSGGHPACSAERRKQCTYSYTHTKTGVGQKTWQEWREGGKAALVLGTYIADSDFCMIIRSRTLGFATAGLPPSSRVTRGK